MTKYSLLLILLFSLLGTSCKEGKKPDRQIDSEISETPLKDISELTYIEIFYLLHQEDEYGMDVHGDMFGQEAMNDVNLVNDGSTDCGNAISINNSHNSDNIKVAVKTTFKFPGNPANEMFRAYVIKPGETAPVGHSKLCYKGAEYDINREIVSAGFTDDE